MLSSILHWGSGLADSHRARTERPPLHRGASASKKDRLAAPSISLTLDPLSNRRLEWALYPANPLAF